MKDIWSYSLVFKLVMMQETLLKISRTLEEIFNSNILL